MIRIRIQLNSIDKNNIDPSLKLNFIKNLIQKFEQINNAF